MVVGGKVLVEEELRGWLLWKEVRACLVMDTAGSRCLCNRPNTGHSRAHQPSWWHLCKNLLKSRKHWWGREQRREWGSSERRSEQKEWEIEGTARVGGAPWWCRHTTEGTVVCWGPTLEHRRSMQRRELQRETTTSWTTIPCAARWLPEGTECNLQW